MLRLGLRLRRIVREIGLPAIIGWWAGTITVYVLVEAVSSGGLKVIAAILGGVLGAIAGVVFASRASGSDEEKVSESSTETSAYSSLDELMGYDVAAPIEFSGEDLLKLWALTKSLVEKLSSRPLETAIVVVSEEGVPEAVYPDDAPVFIDDEEDAYDITAVLEEGWVIAVLPLEAAAIILNSIDDGLLRVKSEEELHILYMLAKKLAYALGQKHEIAAYSAYKALLKLVNEGVIVMSEDMARLLPLEPEEVRRRVREQVKLEDTLKA